MKSLYELGVGYKEILLKMYADKKQGSKLPGLKSAQRSLLYGDFYRFTASLGKVNKTKDESFNLYHLIKDSPFVKGACVQNLNLDKYDLSAIPPERFFPGTQAGILCYSEYSIGVLREHPSIVMLDATHNANK